MFNFFARLTFAKLVTGCQHWITAVLYHQIALQHLPSELFDPHHAADVFDRALDFGVDRVIVRQGYLNLAR